MATTTNYGWTTPDDTALVKDGAAAIRTLGSSVDTTTKALNPSTTLGDIEYRSSTANTNTRLGIGSTGQVLTVAGGVPSWATASSGSMTLLSTTTLSGASTTISSISGSYKALKVWMKLYDIANNTGHGINLRLNSNTSTTYSTRTGNSSNEAYGDTSITVNVNISASTIVGFAELEIPNYAQSGVRKTVQIISHTANYFTTGNMEFRDCTGVWSQTDAINELTFFPSSGNFDGGTIEIYGVN